MKMLKGANLRVGGVSSAETRALNKASKLFSQEVFNAYLDNPQDTRRKIASTYLKGKFSKSEFEALMKYLWKVDSIRDLLNKGRPRAVGENFKKAVIEAAHYARMGKTFSLGRAEGFKKKGPIEDIIKNPGIYSKEALLKAEKIIKKEAGLE